MSDMPNGCPGGMLEGAKTLCDAADWFCSDDCLYNSLQVLMPMFIHKKLPQI